MTKRVLHTGPRPKKDGFLNAVADATDAQQIVLSEGSANDIGGVKTQITEMVDPTKENDIIMENPILPDVYFSDPAYEADLSNFSCEKLKSYIESIRNLLATSKFAAHVIFYYQNKISLAEGFLSTCKKESSVDAGSGSVKDTNNLGGAINLPTGSTITVGSTLPPSGGGGSVSGGGGSGAGAGSSAASTTKKSFLQDKSKLIFAGIAGLLLGFALYNTSKS